MHRNGLCGGCGHPLAETTDPDMEGQYLPDGFIQCYRCTAIEQAIEVVEDAVKANPNAHKRRGTYRYDIKRLLRRRKP